MAATCVGLIVTGLWPLSIWLGPWSGDHGMKLDRLLLDDYEVFVVSFLYSHLVINYTLEIHNVYI